MSFVIELLGERKYPTGEYIQIGRIYDDDGYVVALRANVTDELRAATRFNSAVEASVFVMLHMPDVYIENDFKINRNFK